MAEFEAVIETRDVVEGLHDFQEFSRLPSVKMRLCKHGKKSSTAFIKYYSGNVESVTSQPCLHTLMVSHLNTPIDQ